MFTYKLVEVDIKGSEQSTRQPFGSGLKRSKKVHRLRTFSTSRRLAKKIRHSIRKRIDFTHLYNPAIKSYSSLHGQTRDSHSSFK